MPSRPSATPMLTWGLVSAKVAASPAAEKVAGFSNACDGGGTHQLVRARMGSLRCPDCGAAPTVKVRVLGKDELVPVPKDEIDAVAEANKQFKPVVSVNVHKAEEMTKMLPAPEGKVYMSEPYDESHAGNYRVILNRVKAHPELIFTAYWAVSTIPAPYWLREYQDRLVLVELAEPAAIRPLPVLPDVPTPADAMAEAVLAATVTPYDPDQYRNTAREKLEQLIATSTPVAAGTATPVPVLTGDALMAALRSQVEQAQQPTPITAAPSKRKPRSKVSA